MESSFPDIDKYVENVEQGFNTPCFFVNLMEYSKENLNGSERFLREKETIDIQVIYFPKEEKDRRTEKRQIANIIPNLVRCVEYIQLYDKNVVVKTTGGLFLKEQAANLAVLMSIISSVKNRPIPPDWAFIADVGLTGELKRVPAMESRIRELDRMGYRKIFTARGVEKHLELQNAEIIPCRLLQDVMAKWNQGYGI